MRKLILSALMAAVVLPTAAGAQSYGEPRRDRQDIRGDWRDARGDLRDTGRNYRDDRDRRDDRNRDWGRNDWQRHRAQNRALYARGNWRAPFRYNAFRPGVRIAPVYYGQRYWINDPWRYRLPVARPNTRWVRHYNDVLLIDYRRGVVVEVIRNFYW